ncbi:MULTISPECIES: S-layer homology domain-containing protein [unclassified Paenibacillus]|uniref:S-layer homology domain-containing protein n=1 Tax=unclassified Paenibacillus TaxID=185978 RepID=UPI001AEA1EDE|nr:MULTISPECIES: S-layer homology domain-containing protein [unclassified Paenibacillus]MBP1154424.1 hypothetical protein [Paenibacillus sp. PvP091]MBP1170192.1 hypothetical protein [Paenibacillus sp. PvR098]MBP2441220.1 hypothetical protein [Paenibacillus sp. PvP052]
MHTRTVRYYVTILLMVSMLFSLFSAGTANAAEPVNPGSNAGAAASTPPPFKDIADSYAVEEIEALVNAGILGGYEDGTFQPREAMTRAQLAKVLVLALGLEEDAAAASPFTDVPAHSWFEGYVGALLQTGITDGTSPTTFSPDSPVTREQLAVFFVRAMKLEELALKLTPDAALSDFGQISDWAKAHVSLAFKIGFLQGIDNGDGTLRFSPQGAADRQALARLAYEFKFNQTVYSNKANQLTSTQGQLLDAAIQAANEAIEALPALNSLKLSDKAAVEAARSKVEDARKLGAADKDFSNLSKLANAEKKIAELSKGGGLFSGGGGGGGGGGPVVGDTREMCSIEAGTHTGRIKVCSGVTVFGPEQGLAVIQGTLVIDPGSAGELELRNIQADNVEVLSGAENSIVFSANVTITNLFINTSNQNNQVRVVTSATTVITRTEVSSQAILESQAGSFGNIDVVGAAANRDVELRGTISGTVTVTAVSSTLVVAPNATVAQVNVATSVSVESSGTVTQLAVTAAASNSTVNLSGSFTTTTVSVAASGSTLNVGQNTTVSQVQVTAAATISSNGTVNQVGITSAVAVSLSGSFTTTTVNVAATGSTLTVGQNTTVSTVVIAQTVTNMTIVANGSITTVETTATVTIELTGSTVNQVRDSSKQAALRAINALPAVITHHDREAVEAAGRKVNGAKLLGATFTDGELSKLNNAKNKLEEIKSEAIQGAVAAIAALPPTVKLGDKPAVLAARAKVEEAIAKGATAADITNLSVLTAAETKLQDTMPPAITSASATIAGIPAEAVIGSNNAMTFTLSASLQNTAMVTGFTIHASADADQLTVSELGITRTIQFTNGTAHALVSELLGLTLDPQGDGVSVGKLREELAARGGSITLSGTLTDHIGNPSNVTFTITRETDTTPPTVSSAEAIINGSIHPAVISNGNTITFTLSKSLNNTDMFTVLQVEASNDAKQLTIAEAGITRTIGFVNGEAHAQVSQLLGIALDPQGDGVSVGKLRELLAQQGGSITVSGTLTDHSGNPTAVTLTIIKENIGPVVFGALATIDSLMIPAIPADSSAHNSFTIRLGGTLADSAMFTNLMIHASEDAVELTGEEFGIRKTVQFTNGTADMTVSSFLGSAVDRQGDGVSVGKLRGMVGTGSLTFTGTISGNGTSNPVTITIIVE